MVSNMPAQDIHHSQFYTSPLNVNPAQAGVFNGDQRLTLNYRRQWFVDDLVKYMTLTGSFDLKFFPRRWDRRGIWNAGLLFNYDQAGDSRLSLAHIGLAVSFAYPFNPRNIVTIGASVAGAQRRFNQEDLTWDRQWNGSRFDPTLPAQENFATKDRGFLDVSAGVNYRWQRSMRTKLDVGISAMHINRAEQRFFNNSPNTRLPIRFNVSALPSFKITERFDLLLHGQYQSQKPYVESVVGGYAKFYINRLRGRELALSLGLASRFSDALIPKVALDWNKWRVGFSFDYNFSPFRVATLRKGGPEFSLIYINTKPRPISPLKVCPIY